MIRKWTLDKLTTVKKENVYDIINNLEGEIKKSKNLNNEIVNELTSITKEKPGSYQDQIFSL